VERTAPGVRLGGNGRGRWALASVGNYLRTMAVVLIGWAAASHAIYRTYLQTHRVLAVLITIGVVGYLSELALRALEGAVVPWERHRSESHA
jgi:hypothetical protein